MSWVVLVVSGVLEAVWATALGRSEGLSRPVPSVVFLVGLVLSMGGLAWALRDLPVGTAYAVWVGIGAAVTVAWAMVTGAESVSVVKVLLILGIVGCVVGLKLVHEDRAPDVADRSGVAGTTAVTRSLDAGEGRDLPGR